MDVLTFRRYEYETPHIQETSDLMTLLVLSLIDLLSSAVSLYFKLINFGKVTKIKGSEWEPMLLAFTLRKHNEVSSTKSLVLHQNEISL